VQAGLVLEVRMRDTCRVSIYLKWREDLSRIEMKVLLFLNGVQRTEATY
jgi:hypothetical protein